MDPFFPIFIAVAAVVLVLVLAFMTGVFSLKKFLPHHLQVRRPPRLKTLEERTQRSPNNSTLLSQLADAYYNEGQYAKAGQAYQKLQDLSEKDKNVDKFHVHVRHGICMMKTHAYNVAYHSFQMADSITRGTPEVDKHIGILEYMRKNYIKAIDMLRRALEELSDDKVCLRFMGLAQYKMRRYQRAIPFLRSALSAPESDSEVQYALSVCLEKMGLGKQALQGFSGLTADPRWRSPSALQAGKIFLKTKAIDEAISMFKAGLKQGHPSIEMALKLRFQLHLAYAAKNQINEAYDMLKEIQQINPSYPNLATFLGKYEELHSNRRLQSYLFGTPEEFTAMCRRLVSHFAPPGTTVEILSSELKRNGVNLLAKIRVNQLEELILCHFSRSEAEVKATQVRTFYIEVKDSHASRGFYVVPATFEAGVQQFAEGRPLDLCDRSKLKEEFNKF